MLQLTPGQPPRLCGQGSPNTLALSRAFGDNWAVPLGLTAEPDAVTVALPPPTPISLGRSINASFTTLPPPPRGADSGSSSDEDGGRPPRIGARHVLVVGCDGLYDMVANEEVVSIALR